MSKQLVFSLLIAFVMLAGCRKKQEEATPIPQNCKLVSLSFATLEYNTENQLVAMQSAFGRMTFKYNTEGKIVHASFYTSDGVLLLYQTYEWSNNMLAYTSYNQSGSISEKVWYEFDAQQRIIKHTEQVSSYQVVHHYEYDSNGNVRKVFKQDPYTNNGVEYLSLEFTQFDDKKNPYHDSPLRIFMIENSNAGFHNSKNNATAYKAYNSDGSFRTYTLAHKYNAQGLITVMETPSGNIRHFGYECK